MKNPQRIVDSTFDRLQARSGLAAKNLSQMNKLLPQLELSGKKEKDQSQITAGLETRAARLKALRTSLQKTVVSLSKLYVVPKEEQLKKLSASLKKVKGIIDDKPPIGVSKQLRACVNELTSLREGVYTGAAVDKKTLSIIACNKAVEHLDTLIASNKRSIEKNKAGSEVTAADDEGMYGDIEKVLQQTQKEADNINALHRRPFVLTRVPLIPITKAILSVDALKLKGFKADNLGGYPVLHNQLVIGINKSMLELKDAEKAKSITPQRMLEQAEKVKKMIEKQMGVKLYFVDEKAYGAQGGAWYWVMSERELKLFSSVFPGRHVQLQRFGFAF